MLTWQKWLLLISCTGLVIYGCSPKTVDTPASPAAGLTEADMVQIAEAYGAIAQSATPILHGSTPEKIRAAYQAQSSTYRKISGVNDVRINPNELVVTFTKGIQVVWSFGYPESESLSDDELDEIMPQSISIPGTTDNRQARTAADYPGNKKVVWINQHSNDDGHGGTASFYPRIRASFLNKNYTVDNIPNEAMTLDFMGSQLSQYGVIFLNSHGAYDEATGHTWICTGARAIGDAQMNRLASPFPQPYKDDFIAYLNQYVQLQNDERFLGLPMRVNVYEERQQNNYVYRAYIEISDELVQRVYAKKRFPNSLVLLNICQGSKDRNKALLKAFTANSAKLALGWDEIQNIGVRAFANLLSSMLAGYSFADAYEQIPNNLRNGCMLPECSGYANMKADPSLSDDALKSLYLYKADLSSGLVAYFPFEGNAADKSGNNNHGQANGIDYVAGQKGKGAYFHGVQQADASFSNVDKIFLQPSSSLTFQNGMTISFWIKLPTDTFWPDKATYCNGATLTGYTFGWGGIFSRMPDDLASYQGPIVRVPPGFQCFVNLSPNIGTGITSQHYDLTPYLSPVESSLASFITSSDRFLHVVMVFKGKTVKFYTDGSENGSAELPRPLYAEAADKPILIGAGRNVHLPFTAKHYLYSGAVAEHFHCFQYIHPLEGVLDELRIYNRALSAPDVKQLYETDRQ
ncbi:hypothetical protein GCM10028808_16350 [Spirosoma migulaei]